MQQHAYSTLSTKETSSPPPYEAHTQKDEETRYMVAALVLVIVPTITGLIWWFL
jgi:hypothetical protein